METILQTPKHAHILKEKTERETETKHFFLPLCWDGIGDGATTPQPKS